MCTLCHNRVCAAYISVALPARPPGAGGSQGVPVMPAVAWQKTLSRVCDLLSGSGVRNLNPSRLPPPQVAKLCAAVISSERACLHRKTVNCQTGCFDTRAVPCCPSAFARQPVQLCCHTHSRRMASLVGGALYTGRDRQRETLREHDCAIVPIHIYIYIYHVLCGIQRCMLCREAMLHCQTCLWGVESTPCNIVVIVRIEVVVVVAA